MIPHPAQLKTNDVVKVKSSKVQFYVNPRIPHFTVQEPLHSVSYVLLVIHCFDEDHTNKHQHFQWQQLTVCQAKKQACSYTDLSHRTILLFFSKFPGCT